MSLVPMPSVSADLGLVQRVSSQAFWGTGACDAA